MKSPDTGNREEPTRVDDQRKSTTPTRVTRSDVAAAAGVSATTVTHALNPRPGVRMSSATRERVRRIARDLGYRPNFVGRALVSGRTYTVGLLQPRRESIFSQFYQQMIFGMAEPMEDDEYHLLLLFRSAQDRFMNLVNQGRIDGMFVLQSDLETAHIETVVRAGLPTVVVNKHYDVPTGSGAASVHSDHNGLMREILAEFVSAGSRTLLAFHDYRFCDANTRMQNALLSAVSELADAGIVVSTVIPDHAGLSRQVGNMFGSGQRWDGIFVDGAAVADTVIEEARRHGLEAGTDYELIVAETQPGRTTGSRAERCVYCHQPEEVGRAAWDVMRQLLHGGAVPALVRVPYTRLSVRCAAAHSDTVSNAIQTGGMQPPAEEKPACET